jgi:hypothetical protein
LNIAIKEGKESSTVHSQGNKNRLELKNSPNRNEVEMRTKNAKLLLSALVLLVIAGVISAVLILPGKKSLPVWLVEESLVEKWGAVLASIEVQPPFTDIEIYQEGSLPGMRHGYIITTKLIQPFSGSPIEDEPEAMVRVHSNLARTLEYEGALLLALDPWAVFFEYTDSTFSRERAEGNGDLSGLLVAPGGDPRARIAWLSQLLQEDPGVFPGGKEFWKTRGDALFQSNRFQHGAFTYNWSNSWDLFLENKPSWIYAPLSMARNLRSSQSAGFAAARFPEPRQWNNYGIQAELLWAVPFGREEKLQEINAVESWLKDGAVQTLIANTLKWIPAAPGGSPYNAFSRTIQLTWLRSSFVWEDLRR